MQLSVVGAGYVGLVTAACLAKLGNVVRCVDIDEARIARLRAGEVPIREPGLDDLVAAGLTSGTLSFHSDSAAMHGSALAIVAVGTLDEHDEWTDRVVRRAVESVARDPRAPRHIVIRSTLLPGTAASIAASLPVIDERVRLALNPEFTREASAVDDFLLPDRVVIGVADPDRDAPLVAELRRLYQPLECPIVVTDLTSAETIKVASNVFLATKISFANELARLCEATGADVLAVVDGMGLDRRIGRSFLTPGPGFGGSCFPPQARALPAHARAHGVSTRLMDAVAMTNEEQSVWVLERALSTIERGDDPVRIAILGLTFKAGTDDLRESPAMRLARLAHARGALVSVHDPMAGAAGAAELRAAGVEIRLGADAVDACSGADAVIVATEWPEYGRLDWAAVASTMRGNVVVDARHVVDRAGAGAAGLRVLTMGGTSRRDEPGRTPGSSARSDAAVEAAPGVTGAPTPVAALDARSRRS